MRFCKLFEIEQDRQILMKKSENKYGAPTTTEITTVSFGECEFEHEFPNEAARDDFFDRYNEDSAKAFANYADRVDKNFTEEQK